jgi:hypothetical protein
MVLDQIADAAATVNREIRLVVDQAAPRSFRLPLSWHPHLQQNYPEEGVMKTNHFCAVG